MKTIKQICYAEKSNFTEVRKSAKNKKKRTITIVDVFLTIAVLQFFTLALLLNAIIINLLNN